jgi:hypothetical protein
VNTRDLIHGILALRLSAKRGLSGLQSVNTRALIQGIRVLYLSAKRGLSVVPLKKWP